MLIDFSGRRALVTGAAQGIGRAIALALVRDGASVVAADIVAGPLEDLAGSLAGADAGRIVPAPCDLTVAAEVRQLAAAQGPFDILVHSAGGVRGQVGRPLEEVSEADWDAIVGINM